METTTVERPLITATKLATANLDDWRTVTEALRDTPALETQQGWLTTPQDGFAPTRVRTGWTNAGLVVWGELDDADIFNPVTTFNEPTFRHGDAFEIFLRPGNQEVYFEFHISPENQLFQLRIPSANHFAMQRLRGGVNIEALKIKQPVIHSRVKVDRAAGRWSVLALVPFQVVIESKLPPPAGPWLASFSRYDYTRGRHKPIVSSTSPHVRADFHRQQEWGELRFGE